MNKLFLSNVYVCRVSAQKGTLALITKTELTNSFKPHPDFGCHIREEYHYESVIYWI